VAPGPVADPAPTARASGDRAAQEQPAQLTVSLMQQPLRQGGADEPDIAIT